MLVLSVCPALLADAMRKGVFNVCMPVFLPTAIHGPRRVFAAVLVLVETFRGYRRVVVAMEHLHYRRTKKTEDEMKRP